MFAYIGDGKYGVFDEPRAYGTVVNTYAVWTELPRRRVQDLARLGRDWRRRRRRLRSRPSLALFPASSTCGAGETTTHPRVWTRTAGRGSRASSTMRFQRRLFSSPPCFLRCGSHASFDFTHVCVYSSLMFTGYATEVAWAKARHDRRLRAVYRRLGRLSPQLDWASHPARGRRPASRRPTRRGLCTHLPRGSLPRSASTHHHAPEGDGRKNRVQGRQVVRDGDFSGKVKCRIYDVSSVVGRPVLGTPGRHVVREKSPHVKRLLTGRALGRARHPARLPVPPHVRRRGKAHADTSHTPRRARSRGKGNLPSAGPASRESGSAPRRCGRVRSACAPAAPRHSFVSPHTTHFRIRRGPSAHARTWRFTAECVSPVRQYGHVWCLCDTRRCRSSADADRNAAGHDSTTTRPSTTDATASPHVKGGAGPGEAETTSDPGMPRAECAPAQPECAPAHRTTRNVVARNAGALTGPRGMSRHGHGSPRMC